MGVALRLLVLSASHVWKVLSCINPRCALVHLTERSTLFKSDGQTRTPTKKSRRHSRSQHRHTGQRSCSLRLIVSWHRPECAPPPPFMGRSPGKRNNCSFLIGWKGKPLRSLSRSLRRTTAVHHSARRSGRRCCRKSEPSKMSFLRLCPTDPRTRRTTNTPGRSQMRIVTDHNFRQIRPGD